MKNSLFSIALFSCLFSLTNIMCMETLETAGREFAYQQRQQEENLEQRYKDEAKDICQWINNERQKQDLIYYLTCRAKGNKSNFECKKAHPNCLLPLLKTDEIANKIRKKNPSIATSDLCINSPFYCHRTLYNTLEHQSTHESLSKKDEALFEKLKNAHLAIARSLRKHCDCSNGSGVWKES